MIIMIFKFREESFYRFGHIAEEANLVWGPVSERFGPHVHLGDACMFG